MTARTPINDLGAAPAQVVEQQSDQGRARAVPVSEATAGVMCGTGPVCEKMPSGRTEGST